MDPDPEGPDMVALGDRFDLLKKGYWQRRTAVLECVGCGKKAQRPKPKGAYVFQALEGRACPQCGGTTHRVVQIIAEWENLQGSIRRQLGRK
jgi:hypothetical protein